MQNADYYLSTLAVCEKNTVEANHYGGATTDHFTLTEWFETGELGKVGGKPLEIRFHFRSSRNCCTTIRKLNRPPLEHLSKTLEKYGAESTR